jgi:2-polyprenyl-3-methyl-5-hydroxy-6-metoxy-1,4-benzoquinol methylase
MKTKSPLQYRVFKAFYRKAAQKMCEECSQFISSNSKILDFGCGSGIIGKEFSKFFNSEILGIDIIDNRVENIPFVKYDGKDISFLAKESYDTILINYVLHHTEDPTKSLKDISKIAKKRIIIYENLPEGIVSKFFCKIHGISFGIIFQKNFVSGKFFTRQEWENKFKDLNLKLIYAKTISGFSPMKTVLFVLEKE